MADTKISALPASTLPLVGDEILPIVQGGVTKQVVNNDLRPKQIQSNTTSGVLQITGPAAAATRTMTTPDSNFTAARTDAAQNFTGNQRVGTTTDEGSLSNTTQVIAGNFRTFRAQNVNIPANGTATVMTLPSTNAGTYIVSASFGAQGNEIYGGMAIIIANAGSFRLQLDGSGTRCTITLSGANVQITNALGVALDSTTSVLYIGAE